MKKNYIYIIISAALLGLSSCSDFLDRYPFEELSDGSFWKTPNDAEMAVSNLYGVLPSMNVDADINSDNAVHGIKWAAGNVSKGIYDPNDMGWSGDYKNIRQANIIFEKIDEIPNFETQRKNRVLAQAHFFRAYVYFGLIQQFGDVPYVDRTLSLADQKKLTRTPRAEVYNKVMADLDFAIANLPVAWAPEEYGRITKGAARAFKARVALYYGNWDVAMTASKEVMDQGTYELFDKDNTGLYAELFWEKQEMSKENILVRQYNYPDKTHYLIGWHCFPTQGWGGINPTQSLVDSFEDKDGAPIAKSLIYDETKPFENRDPRLAVNVLTDGEVMYGDTVKVAPLKSSGNTGIGQHNDATATGYYLKKWLDPSVKPATDGWDMGKDIVDIRYAEVLLTYAEAKNELTPLDPTAFAAVNQVRQRVGMPILQNSDASLPTFCGTQDELRQRIRNEWRVEFALEGGKRQWDIRRWGIAEQVLNAPFQGLKYTLIKDEINALPGDGKQVCILYVGENVKLPGSRYKPHNYVYPVPQEERDLNPNLTQNPGY